MEEERKDVEKETSFVEEGNEDDQDYDDYEEDDQGVTQSLKLIPVVVDR